MCSVSTIKIPCQAWLQKTMLGSQLWCSVIRGCGFQQLFFCFCCLSLAEYNPFPLKSSRMQDTHTGVEKNPSSKVISSTAVRCAESNCRIVLPAIWKLSKSKICHTPPSYGTRTPKDLTLLPRQIAAASHIVTALPVLRTEQRPPALSWLCF